MVSSSRTEGGAQVLSAGVRRTIQSIKEVVRNHSDSDIYVALKENDMDPYETIQRLLNQDPFHLVKRRRDRRQESKGSKSSASEEARRTSEVETVRVPVKNNSYVDHDSQRVGTGRNVSSGATVEFHAVQDNRIAQNSSRDSKLAQSSTATCKMIVFDKSLKSPGHQTRRMGQLSSQASNVPTEPQPGKIKPQPGKINNPKSDSSEGKELSEKRLPVSDSSQVQKKANESQNHSSDSPSSSVVGVYSSSSDPFHVPSSNARPAANYGAIKREVGPRRLSSEHATKSASSQPSPLAQDDDLNSLRTLTVVSKSDKSSQRKAPKSLPIRSAGRPVSNYQHNGRFHQNLSRHKDAQPNKEWKPKSIVKPSINCPDVIKAPAQPASPPADNPEDLKTDAVQMQDNMSRLNLSENHNVIIAAHIHVSESDRSRLTFGSLGTQLGSLKNSDFIPSNGSEELSTGHSESVPMSAPESSESDPSSNRQLTMADASVQSLGSSSPASGVESDRQLFEKKDSLSPQRPENDASVGLVRDTSPSYNSESQKQQGTSELPSFSGYEPQMDMSYFHPVDETITGPGLPSPKEVMYTNSVPASTISMVQQQQHMAQMYPQMPASQFANLMPYRPFLPPVYVPPMSSYSNNPAYPHPSNGSNYMLMPGNSSHLTQSGVKYGMQQFKPVPSANFPTGFENFTSPAGYAISTPGLVGSLEDASRLKYKDSPYVVPNAQQAETSEIWLNPRDMSGLQSASYYNISGQTPHAAYLASHNGQVSFNPAAAAAQSSNMQFQGMYHHPPQPSPIASPHPLGPTIPANAAAHAGVYQQPQMGHMNWTANF